VSPFAAVSAAHRRSDHTLLSCRQLTTPEPCPLLPHQSRHQPATCKLNGATRLPRARRPTGALARWLRAVAQKILPIPIWLRSQGQSTTTARCARTQTRLPLQRRVTLLTMPHTPRLRRSVTSVTCPSKLTLQLPVPYRKQEMCFVARHCNTPELSSSTSITAATMLTMQHRQCRCSRHRRCAGSS
jgi:hypothetical protein